MEDNQVTLTKNVAEWLERCKANGWSLGQAIQDISSEIDEDTQYWLWGPDFRLRQVDFAKAWIHGYIIEPDRYIVEIPNPNSDDRFGLFRRTDGKVAIGSIILINGNFPDVMKLKEEEIKKDFPWVFEHGFVKKV